MKKISIENIKIGMNLILLFAAKRGRVEGRHSSSVIEDAAHCIMLHTSSNNGPFLSSI